MKVQHVWRQEEKESFFFFVCAVKRGILQEPLECQFFLFAWPTDFINLSKMHQIRDTIFSFIFFVYPYLSFHYKRDLSNSFFTIEMLTNTLNILVNNLFQESFDTTFMRNKKKTVIILIAFFSFPIKIFFNWIVNKCPKKHSLA